MSDKKKQQPPPTTQSTGKKPLPSVSYLLKHGDPETAHLPKTWCEIIGYPLALAIVFAISLLIFHYAPREKSTHRGFQLPQKRMQDEMKARRDAFLAERERMENVVLETEEKVSEGEL